MNHKDSARLAVESHTDALIALSHRIHAHPETAFEEVRACEWVSSPLDDLGFEVRTGVADLPTAFVATIGNGPLHIGICAEYDALPNIGHACGHNVIAAAAVGAAAALAPLVDDLGITVSVFGTPAEEGGGGKILMLQRGAFDGINAAMMIHPSPFERDAMGTLAVSQLRVDFHGKAAHAAASPHRGVSASAALALSQMGIGMLREHTLDSDRIHGIVTNGGDAPNIVPEHTQGRWFVRSAAMDRLAELEPHVHDVFKGGALMTGCRCEIRKTAPSYSDLRTDEALAERWRANARDLGRTSLPLQADDGAASTDMGNVSYAVPTLHPLVAIDSNGANIHEAEFQRHAAGASADKALIDGAVGMAWTAIDMATDEALRARLLQHRYVATDVPAAERAYLDEGYGTVIGFPTSD